MTFETLGYNSTDALGFIYPSRGEFIFLVCYYHINGIHTTSISWQITFRGELKRKGRRKEISVLSQRKAWKPHNHIGMRHHKHTEVYRDASEQ
jgi:hypothetical protein